MTTFGRPWATSAISLPTKNASIFSRQQDRNPVKLETLWKYKEGTDRGIASRQCPPSASFSCSRHSGRLGRPVQHPNPWRACGGRREEDRRGLERHPGCTGKDRKGHVSDPGSGRARVRRPGKTWGGQGKGQTASRQGWRDCIPRFARGFSEGAAFLRLGGLNFNRNTPKPSRQTVQRTEATSGHHYPRHEQ